jgi:tetratricopeptide (TPR) repeat protein
MGTRNSKKDKELGALDELVAEITVDACGDDEQLWAFRQAFEDDVTLPADGFVIGDAHLHLGNFVFDHHPKDAIRHYEVGLRISELSLGDDFTGVLAWGLINNRPFLRCMHGYGLCLWRLGRFDEAEHVFEKMLWLNPSDNQGVRFLIDEVKAKTAWKNREVE